MKGQGMNHYLPSQDNSINIYSSRAKRRPDRLTLLSLTWFLKGLRGFFFFFFFFSTILVSPISNTNFCKVHHLHQYHTTGHFIITSLSPLPTHQSLRVLRMSCMSKIKHTSQTFIGMRQLGAEGGFETLLYAHKLKAAY